MLHIIGALLSCSVMIAVVWKFKFVAALGQMGSIQERSAPWAGHTQQNQGDRKQITENGGEEEPVTPSSTTTSGTKNMTTEELSRKVEKSLQTRDKFIYTMGVMNFGFSAYLLGAAPAMYWMWHVPKSIVYIAHRWYTFKQQGQHYYLFDFCYWANALSLIYIFICPQNEFVFTILFLVSNGPLAWSVCAFNNSMIFHSAPHLTSLFIHTSPMIFTYGVRWYPSEFRVCENWPSCDSGNETPSDWLTNAFGRVFNANVYFYLWWAVLYYVWIYILRAQHIKEKGYETLFDYVVKDTPIRVLTKLTSDVTMQRIIYLCVHLLFGSVVMMLASLFHYHSWVAHMVFVVAIVGASCWNASGYYFTVFVRRYESTLHKRVETKVDKLK